MSAKILIGTPSDAVGGAYLGRQSRMFSLFNPRPAAAGGPLLEVDAAGTGFLLLSRACMLRMASAFPGRMFELAHGVGDDPYNLNGEDWTYCARWRGLGGRIHADPSFRMSHFGERDCNAMLHETANRGWGRGDATRTGTPVEPTGAADPAGAGR